MYKKILVPLDGSKLAECAVPHAEEVARGCGAEKVILVSVTERAQGYRAVDDPSRPQGVQLVPEAVGKQEKQARRYLGRVAEAMEAKGIRVDTEVLLGDPAEEIVIYVKHPGCDLIVMSSHGRSGIHRWRHGSIADRVFRGSRVPVLMVKAQD
jgi:nucleotide-binding universal stress UspA family protein